MQMSPRRRHIEPVDATSMQEWEADRSSHVGAALLFWCWYLPADTLRPRRRLRAAIAELARARALLRYPLYPAPIRDATTKLPVRR